MISMPARTISLEALINSLPEIIWFKDNNLNYIASSQTLNDFVGFPKRDYIVNKSDYDLPWEDYGDVYRDGDDAVMRSQKAMTFLHAMRSYSGEHAIILTHKKPVFNESNEIIGINGTVSLISKSNTIQDFLTLNKYDDDLKNQNQRHAPIQYILCDDLSKFNLSKREMICLFYLMRGKTAKEIADILHISRRTVEKHVDNIKIKLNCKSKSEVISKAIDLGFIYYIPKEFLF